MCGYSILPGISYRRLNQKLKWPFFDFLDFFPLWISAKRQKYWNLINIGTTIKFCLHASLAMRSFSRVELTELAKIFQ